MRSNTDNKPKPPSANRKPEHPSKVFSERMPIVETPSEQKRPSDAKIAWQRFRAIWLPPHLNLTPAEVRKLSPKQWVSIIGITGTLSIAAGTTTAKVSQILESKPATVAQNSTNSPQKTAQGTIESVPSYTETTKLIGSLTIDGIVATYARDRFPETIANLPEWVELDSGLVYWSQAKHEHPSAWADELLRVSIKNMANYLKDRPKILNQNVNYDNPHETLLALFNEVLQSSYSGAIQSEAQSVLQKLPENSNRAKLITQLLIRLSLIEKERENKHVKLADETMVTCTEEFPDFPRLRELAIIEGKKSTSKSNRLTKMEEFYNQIYTKKRKADEYLHSLAIEENTTIRTLKFLIEQGSKLKDIDLIKIVVIDHSDQENLLITAKDA